MPFGVDESKAERTCRSASIAADGSLDRYAALLRGYRPHPVATARPGWPAPLRSGDPALLEFVARLKATGMPLAGMVGYAGLLAAGDGTSADRLALLEEPGAKVAAQIGVLTEALDASTARSRPIATR